MALDPLSIATDGYLSKYKWTLSVATRGYLSQFALVVIPIPPKPAGALGFGVLYTDDTMQKKEVQLHHEDDEILLIMQIFMMKWN
jgi:hypothetical protein